MTRPTERETIDKLWDELLEEVPFLPLDVAIHKIVEHHDFWENGMNIDRTSEAIMNLVMLKFAHEKNGVSIQTPLKTCNRCGIEKPLEDFALRSSATKGLVPRLWCKECDVPQGMTAEASRRKQLMKLYGLTSEQFQAMGEAQKWQCAICHDDIQAKPYVDHNHATGKVRLLLCFRCNVGLGHFRDSTVFLQAAIDYLILEEKKADLRSSNSFERGN